MMLCDHVAVAEGKFYINGGGWTITGPNPAPSGIAILVSLPWAWANQKVSFSLRLLREDGQPVTQPGPLGETPVRVEGEFEVGRPPGLKPGTPLDVPLALNMPPLLLSPGERFSWELSINDETQGDWHLAFSTRPLPASPSGPTPIPG